MGQTGTTSTKTVRENFTVTKKHMRAFKLRVAQGYAKSQMLQWALEAYLFEERRKSDAEHLEFPNALVTPLDDEKGDHLLVNDNYMIFKHQSDELKKRKKEGFKKSDVVRQALDNFFFQRAPRKSDNFPGYKTKRSPAAPQKR